MFLSKLFSRNDKVRTDVLEQFKALLHERDEWKRLFKEADAKADAWRSEVIKYLNENAKLQAEVQAMRYKMPMDTEQIMMQAQDGGAYGEGTPI